MTVDNKYGFSSKNGGTGPDDPVYATSARPPPPIQGNASLYGTGKFILFF